MDILREATPGVATVADFIASRTDEASEAFARYVDIGCHYGYPIPRDSISKYMGFMDAQREFARAPMWTWVQAFMWGKTATDFNLGVADRLGPAPEPEQLRLLAHAALNRGIRGLLFFSHQSLHVRPELAAATALFCNETRLFNDQLAAGALTKDLPSSSPAVNASSFDYAGSTVVSVLYDPGYFYRWVDEGIIENFSITVPWTGSHDAEGCPRGHA